MKFRWAARGVLEACGPHVCCKCNAWVCVAVMWVVDCLVCGVCHRWEGAGRAAIDGEVWSRVCVLRSGGCILTCWKRMGHLGLDVGQAATTWVVDVAWPAQVTRQR